MAAKNQPWSGSIFAKRSRMRSSFGIATMLFIAKRLYALQGGEDLARLREAAALLLGEDQLTVADYIDLAPGATDVLRRDSALVQLGRETRGPLVIASSGRAVVDLDGHGPSVPPGDGCALIELPAGRPKGGTWRKHARHVCGRSWYYSPAAW